MRLRLKNVAYLTFSKTNCYIDRMKAVLVQSETTISPAGFLFSLTRSGELVGLFCEGIVK